MQGQMPLETKSDQITDKGMLGWWSIHCNISFFDFPQMDPQICCN